MFSHTAAVLRRFRRTRLISRHTHEREAFHLGSYQNPAHGRALHGSLLYPVPKDLLSFCRYHNNSHGCSSYDCRTIENAAFLIITYRPSRCKTR